MIKTILMVPLLASLFFGSAGASGRLVIAGGAVSEDNAAVWGAFAEALPPDGPVFVVAGASSEPSRSAQAAMRALAGAGVDPRRISLARLAVKDDPSTPDVDEARWSRNGESEAIEADMRGAAGVWFTGGDQARLGDLLLCRDGGDTRVLAAMREAAEGGAVIGGTSAGAAMMSRLMITGGSSLDALLGTKGPGEEEGFSVNLGLGFLPLGVTDQHFGERARLGRLIRALSIEPEAARRIGFGVGEGTALIVDDDAFSVAGERYVTVIDATAASFDEVQGRLGAEDIILHLLSEGDRIAPGGDVIAAGFKKPTVGNEYFDRAPPDGGGMAVPANGLADVIGDGLVDNSEARAVSRISFSSEGKGIRYRFEQPRNARGFWGRGPSGAGRYTVTGVRMAVEPVDIEVRELRK